MQPRQQFWGAKMDSNFSLFRSLTTALVMIFGAAGLHAQQPIPAQPATVTYARPGSASNVLKPFLSPSVPETSTANSLRLHALIKDGKM